MAAIFCPPWPKDLELTTTLYPVVVVESFQMSASFTDGWMALIPVDFLEMTQAVISGTYIQKRWFISDGPYDDDLEMTQAVISGTYIQLRWFISDGPYYDFLEMTQAVISGTYVNKLIEADTPDESLQMGISINNTCTMDLI